MAQIDLNALKDALISSVKGRFGTFLEENKAAALLLERVGTDYAALTAQYYLAKDEEAKAVILDELRRVENTLALEEDAIATAVNAEIRGQFLDAVGIVINFARETLPGLIAAL